MQVAYQEFRLEGKIVLYIQLGYGMHLIRYYVFFSPEKFQISALFFFLATHQAFSSFNLECLAKVQHKQQHWRSLGHISVIPDVVLFTTSSFMMFQDFSFTITFHLNNFLQPIFKDRSTSDKLF